CRVGVRVMHEPHRRVLRPLHVGKPLVLLLGCYRSPAAGPVLHRLPHQGLVLHAAALDAAAVVWSTRPRRRVWCVLVHATKCTPSIQRMHFTRLPMRAKKMNRIRRLVYAHDALRIAWSEVHRKPQPSRTSRTGAECGSKTA